MADQVIRCIILAGLLALAGCDRWKAEAFGGGNFCDIAQPHLHSKQAQAAMSDAELATETKHNEYGEKFCGWKP